MMRCSPVPTLLCAAAALWIAGSAAAQTSGTLQKVKETGVFAIAHRDSSLPLSYIGADDKPVGYSIDLCLKVAEAVKAKIGRPDMKIEFVPVNSSNRIPLIQNGTADIECGSTVNYTSRQQQVAFSVTTYPVTKEILTRVNSGIRGIDDLKGKTIAVTQGTDTLQIFTKLNADRHLDLKILQGKDHAESFLLVDTGRAVAFVDDSVLMSAFRATASKPADWVVVPGLPETDPYALMVRKDDPAFKALVDDTIEGLMKSGEFARIYAKWFEQPIPPKGINFQAPMPDTLKELIAHPSDKARL